MYQYFIQFSFVFAASLFVKKRGKQLIEMHTLVKHENLMNYLLPFFLFQWFSFVFVFAVIEMFMKFGIDFEFDQFSMKIWHVLGVQKWSQILICPYGLNKRERNLFSFEGIIHMWRPRKFGISGNPSSTFILLPNNTARFYSL